VFARGVLWPLHFDIRVVIRMNGAERRWLIEFLTEHESWMMSEQQ